MGKRYLSKDCMFLEKFARCPLNLFHCFKRVCNNVNKNFANFLQVVWFDSPKISNKQFIIEK